MARESKVRFPNDIIKSIIDSMNTGEFRTDPEFIQQMKAMRPEFVEAYEEHYTNWKPQIGSRLSEYAKETGHIEPSGRKGGSQVWRVVGAAGARCVQSPSLGSDQCPVRNGHCESVEWMDTDGFLAIKERYDEAFGPYRCFFRATDAGVIVISLDPDCIRCIGVRRSDGDSSHELKVGARPESREYYVQLRSDFDDFKKNVSPDKEGQAVVHFLRRTLAGGLTIQQISKDHCLLNHEWRFAKGMKSDVLAVNLATERLAIIEFKDCRTKKKEEQATGQARHYSGYFLDHKDEYCRFFTRQLNVMGKIYGNERAAAAQVKPHEPELYFGYPSGDDVEIIRIES